MCIILAISLYIIQYYYDKYTLRKGMPLSSPCRFTDFAVYIYIRLALTKEKKIVGPRAVFFFFWPVEFKFAYFRRIAH